MAEYKKPLPQSDHEIDAGVGSAGDAEEPALVEPLVHAVTTTIRAAAKAARRDTRLESRRRPCESADLARQSGTPPRQIGSRRGQ